MKILKNNYIIICYILILVITELLGLFALGMTPVINSPWMMISMIAIGSFILYLIKNNIARFFVSLGLLLFHGIACLAFIIIFEMTGTEFDWGMFALRNDAMGIVETLPINFKFVFPYLILMVLYFIFGKRCLKYLDKPSKKKNAFIIPSLFLALSLTANAFVAVLNNKDNQNGDYSSKLYSNALGNYKEYGMTANFINEAYKGFIFNKVKLGDPAVLEEFIYSEVSTPTSYFGVSSGNNLITILVESLEWYPLIQDGTLYPNGHQGISEADLDYLFPNLRAFMNSSIVLDNYYSREKTDIAENLSIIGSYPTNSYINYDFPSNTNPFTIVNILENEDSSIQSRSYHNGYGSFYNRNKEHKSLGFESFTAAERLVKMGMTDWAAKGQRNLDSEMIEVAKDEMFPTDKRFNTYITSITMHGMYYERENLKRWYEKMDSINACPKSDDENQLAFRNYVAATMEFDYALGIMMQDLADKNLLDKTTITIFGDHNTYYQGLSNYIKDTYSYDHDNYTNLFRVPCMIYDENVGHQVITKFTTNTDVVPTLLDLLGIKYYSNLYFGHSVFSDEESILYSRAYNVFMTDKIYFYSFKNVLYKDSSVDDAYLAGIEQRALTLLKKLEAIDKIFYHNFFKNQDRYNTFISKMNEIN